jgi:hypothetical protein
MNKGDVLGSLPPDRFIDEHPSRHYAVRDREAELGAGLAPVREALDAGDIRAADPNVGSNRMRDVPYWA